MGEPTDIIAPGPGIADIADRIGSPSPEDLGDMLGLLVGDLGRFLLAIDTTIDPGLTQKIQVESYRRRQAQMHEYGQMALRTAQLMDTLAPIDEGWLYMAHQVLNSRKT